MRRRAQPQVPQKALRALQSVSQLAPAKMTEKAVRDLDRAADDLLTLTIKDCVNGGVDPAMVLPAELIPTFVTAADQLNAYIQSTSQQNTASMKVGQACAMLHLWNSIANPFNAEWVLQILPTLAPAAILALSVLTGPAGGIAHDLQDTLHHLTRQHAAVTIMLLGECLTAWDCMIEAQAVQQAGPGGPARRAANRDEAVMVSDLMQKAMLLHASIFMVANRQEGASGRAGSNSSASSSRNWAPREAEQLLEQLQFPVACVQHYTKAVCKAMPHLDPLLDHLKQGLTRVQCAINVRMVGLKQRQYAKRYSHFVPSITPAAARTTGEFHPGRNMMQHIMAQGHYPGQVVNLCLEYLCLLGLGTEGDRLASVIMGLSLMSRMLGFTLGQAEYGLSQQSTAARRQFADTCLQHVWSHLGKDLQRAAGVAETELEGDGSQPAAAEAAAGASSSGGSCGSSSSREVGGMTIRREGVEVQLPADAVARMRLVWDEYGTGLFCAIHLYSECFGQLPFEHYMRQPMRVSRVLEAAFRAADQERIRDTNNMVQLLVNVFWAAETTSPEGSAPTSDLLANRRLAAQSCSEIVSVLKVTSQPLKPSINQQDISEWQVRVASYATMAGPTVLSWALGCYVMDPPRQRAMQALQPDRIQGPGILGTEATTLTIEEALAAPCYSAWLAVTGRALLSVGRAFRVAPSWLQYCMERSSAGSTHEGVIETLSLHASAMGWLLGQMQTLQENPTSSPAAAVPPHILRDLTELTQSLAPKFDRLLKLCDSVALNPALEPTVFRDFLQGCAEGWLHEGLVMLGSGIWAAWPQRYACNDDLCTELARLTESSCGKLKCLGCGVACYCCKEHQKRHWSKHKAVCKHLSKLAKDAPAAT